MKLTENVKVLLLLSILATVILGLLCLKAIDTKLVNFYEHDNKKINLAQIKYINSRVDYIATLSQDKSEDMNRKYSTHFDINEISKIEKILEISKKSDFYDIKIDAYMMFDNEKINLFQSKRYVKLPTNFKVNPHMLGTLKTYGIDDYQYQNLLKLQDQSFTNREDFVNTVIDRAKLKKNDWLVTNIALLGVGQKESDFLKNIDSTTAETILDKSEISTVIDSLKSSYDKYSGIK
ncbi:MAG: hypothetical protein NTZ60_11085 [Campylobacterales bacterium]|nr:hypothetical protein [Campylobacterales bacterium]